MERRLTAILAADVVGYSRLMGVDETGTVAAFKKLRQEVTDPCIAVRQGRIVKTTGDGMLLEFQAWSLQAVLVGHSPGTVEALGDTAPIEKRPSRLARPG